MKKTGNIVYYEVKYRLLEKTPSGSVRDFVADPDAPRRKKTLTAFVTKPTAKAAVEELKSGFKALAVEIEGEPVRRTMTREEYERG